MRLVMLSDHETRGGASIAATRLAVALASAGHDVTRIVCNRDGDGSGPWTTREVDGAPRVLRWLPSASAKHLIGRSAAVAALRRTLDSLRPDAINLHNLHGGYEGGWSARVAAVCAQRAPTVWTLHDMWSFTGRCGYAGACRRYLRGCDWTCPTAGDYPALPRALIAQAWRERRRVFLEAPGLTAASPSRWLAARAAEGLWRDHTVEVIPNGLPLDRFRPLDRREARRALGLDDGAAVLLAAAADLDDPRKGAGTLVAALLRLAPTPITLLLMGSGSAPEVPPHVRAVRLGSVHAPALQSVVYSAADLLVHPAHEDNLPNTVVEALACGTPTRKASVGGLEELVRPGRTGWLVDEVSPDALATGLRRALAAVSHDDLRAACRAQAEEEHDPALQAARYVRLFERLGAAGPPRPTDARG